MKILQSRGFIGEIILVIIAIATLAYFNVDVRGFFENDGIQKVLSIIKGAWSNYIVPLFEYLVNSIIGLFS